MFVRSFLWGFKGGQGPWTFGINQLSHGSDDADHPRKLAKPDCRAFSILKRRRQALCAPASCYSWIIKEEVHFVVLVISLPATSVTQGITMPTQNHIVQNFHSLRRGTSVPGAGHSMMALPASPFLFFPLLLGSKTLSSPFSFRIPHSHTDFTNASALLPKGKERSPDPGFTALLQHRELEECKGRDGWQQKSQNGIL